MQHISSIVTKTQPSGVGSFDQIADLEDFSIKTCQSPRLAKNADRYELLLLVKKLGKRAGITPRAVSLLELYIAYTTAQDWTAGSRPVVFLSLTRLALSLGVTERQVQYLEKQLLDQGFIAKHSSGNGKRFGHRCPQTGKLTVAFGIDLSPLARLQPQLEAQFHEKQLYERAWIDCKREISHWRGKLRSLLCQLVEQGADQEMIESLEQAYGKIAYQLRTHLTLERLRSLLREHKDLHKRLLESLVVSSSQDEQAAQHSTMGQEPQDSSVGNAKYFVHKEYLNLDKKIEQGSKQSVSNAYSTSAEVGGGDRSTAEFHPITLQQICRAASDRFRAHLPIDEMQLSWNDIHEAAYRRRTELRISQGNWQEGCQVLGRTAAALCLLITDRAASRHKAPVENPAGYFRAMVRKGPIGELNLAQSLRMLVSQA